jgi:GWxTD domain-containing protein
MPSRLSHASGSPVPVSIPLLLLLLLVAPAPPAGAAPLPQGQGGAVAALVDSGRVQLERGDTEGARRSFEAALRIDAEHPWALAGMGRVLLADPTGASRAEEYLRRAAARLPNEPSVHYYLGLACLRLAQGDLGRDNAGRAMQELDQVLALDPSHPDAYYQKGVLLRDLYGDAPKAEAAFRMQAGANPAHLQARRDLLRIQVELAEYPEAVRTGEALTAAHPEYPDAYPWLAGAYWRQGDGGKAMEVFERYFGIVEPRERELYFDLSLVLTSEEIAQAKRLGAGGLRAYWDHYWSVRDPDPKTLVNERLLEHFVRVAYARIEFGRADWPWDARGDFYVRYGEPDARSGRGRNLAMDFYDDDPVFLARRLKFQEEMGLPLNMDRLEEFESQAGQRTGFTDAAGAVLMGGLEHEPERWLYTQRGIDVNFIDPTNRGRYIVSGTRSRMLVEQMEVRLPTISEEEEKIVMVDPMDGVFTFRGTAGKTAVEYAFALLPDEFGAFRSVTGVYATLDVDVRVYTPQWEEVARAGEGAKRLQTVPQVTIRGLPLFVDATRLEVAPGDYRIATLLLDPGSGRRATAEELVDVPDYSGSALQVSDILPAASIREVPRGTEGRFVRGNLEVLPLPGRALQSDQPLFIYYEVYNLTKDPIGATDYEVSYAVGEAADEEGLGARLFQGLKSLVGAGRRRSVLTARVERNGITTDSGEYLQIDMSAVPAGTWLLELTVTDRQTGQSTSRRLLFRTLPVR